MSTSPSNPNPGILAAGLVPSVASLRAADPPDGERYRRILGRSQLYRFVPLDGSEDDGYTAIVPSLGGGSWLDVPDDDRGGDITTTSGSLTIGVYGGPWRVIPASTLTGDLALTLDGHYLDGVTAVRKGSPLLVTRLDAGAHAVTFNSTLCTMPSGFQAWALFVADGLGGWVKRASAAMI